MGVANVNNLICEEKRERKKSKARHSHVSQ